MKENITAEQWSIVRQTGCPNIQDAINGRSVEDFDPDMIEWIADLILTAPPDTQVSIKSAPREQ